MVKATAEAAVEVEATFEAAAVVEPEVFGGQADSNIVTEHSGPTQAANTTPTGRVQGHLDPSVADTAPSPGAETKQSEVDDEDEGGRTAANTMAALSRRHHRAKTFLGFHYRHLDNAVLEWTTPLGRNYYTYPHDYRPDGGTHTTGASDPPPASGHRSVPEAAVGQRQGQQYS